MDTIIEVGYREDVFDAIGEGIKKDISDLGIKGVKDILTHQLYLIKGNVTRVDLEFIAENILSDPVTQVYKIVAQSVEVPENPGNDFAVEVWFKKGVTDNVGDSVKKAVNDLDLEGVKEIHSARKIIIKGKVSKEDVINITTRLLANSVVEEYKIYGE